MPSDLPQPAHIKQAQHYIPRLHLRLFGIESSRSPLLGRLGAKPGHVWEITKGQDVLRKVAIRRAAQEPGHYAIDELPDADLEAQFQKIETLAAPVIHQLVEMADSRRLIDLDHAARSVLASYFAFSYLRVPAHTELSWAFATLAARLFVDMHAAHPDKYREAARGEGSTESDEEIEQQRLDALASLRDGSLFVEAHPAAGLADLRNAEEITSHLLARQWVIRRCERFPFLVLDDHPIAFARPPQIPLTEGVGFGTPGVEIIAPLTPQLLFIATDVPHVGELEVWPDRRPTHSLDWATEANRIAWRAARHHVYGHSAGDLVATQLSLSPAMRTYRPSVHVSGLPAEWERYAPEGVIVERQDPQIAHRPDLIHWWWA